MARAQRLGELVHLLGRAAEGGARDVEERVEARAERKALLRAVEEGAARGERLVVEERVEARGERGERARARGCTQRGEQLRARASERLGERRQRAQQLAQREDCADGGGDAPRRGGVATGGGAQRECSEDGVRVGRQRGEAAVDREEQLRPRAQLRKRVVPRLERGHVPQRLEQRRAQEAAARARARAVEQREQRRAAPRARRPRARRAHELERVGGRGVEAREVRGRGGAHGERRGRERKAARVAEVRQQRAGGAVRQVGAPPRAQQLGRRARRGDGPEEDEAGRVVPGAARQRQLLVRVQRRVERALGGAGARAGRGDDEERRGRADIQEAARRGEAARRLHELREPERRGARVEGGKADLTGAVLDQPDHDPALGVAAGRAGRAASGAVVPGLGRVAKQPLHARVRPRHRGARRKKSEGNWRALGRNSVARAER
jgi:hypothetical protein